MAKHIIQCKVCSREFSSARIAAKVCSESCRSKAISISLVGNKRCIGRNPWNKDKKGIHLSSSTEFKKGIIPWIAGKKNPYGTEENHPRWKGELVGYSGIHMWVVKHLGKPSKCEFCERDGLKGKQIHWANKSREYKRELSDWLRLCYWCHRNYDKGYWGIATKKFGLRENYGK